MIKNTKSIVFDLTYQDVTLCYGKKAFSKVMKSITGEAYRVSHGGICMRVTKENKIQYVVAVTKPNGKNNHSVYGVKALWVHELSHLVSMIMEDSHIEDDEFRSHAIQLFYEYLMPWLDSKIIGDKNV